MLGEDAVDGLRVAYVGVDPMELGVLVRQPPRRRLRRGLGAEELRAHVVLEPDDVEALLDEEAHAGRADQSAGPGDDADRHNPTISDAAPPGYVAGLRWARE